MRLKDKVAVITGAAGNIGAATARLFHAQGARVALVDFDAPRLNELAAKLAGAEGSRHGTQVNAGLFWRRFLGLSPVIRGPSDRK